MALNYGVSGLILIIIVRTYYALYTKDYFVRGKKFDIVLRLGTGIILISIVLTILELSVGWVPLRGLLILSVCRLVLIEGFIVSIYHYIISLVGQVKNQTIKQHLWEWIPGGIMLAVIVSSSWTRWLFYFDNSKSYRIGAYQFTIYIFIIYMMGLLIYRLINQFNWTKGGTRISFIMIVAILVLSALTERHAPGRALSSYFIGVTVLVLFFEAQGPLSHRDMLTGLVGRNEMTKIIKSSFKSNRGFSVAVIALDGFKTINTVYGTEKADKILKSIAQYLRTTVSEQQICRFTGDIFLIALPEELTEESMGNYIKAHLNQEWVVDEQIIHVDTTILGINCSICQNEEELISTIELILPYVKAKGKNNHVFVDEQMKADVRQAVRIEDRLREALDKDELEVYYQPIFDARVNCAWAAEALVRLKDSKGNFIPPDQFVVIAERSGYIDALGEVVLEKVCTFIETYGLESMGLHHIDVNLSVIQCLDAELPNRLMRIMEKHHVKPSEIVFEVTETAVSSSLGGLESALFAIKDKGMQIALDDFGMGYANLQYMTRLPFSVVKFDKKMLWDAYGNSKVAAVLEEMAVLIGKLEACVICEGAETLEHIRFLEKLNIYIIQGYYYDEPLPENMFVEKYMKQKESVLVWKPLCCEQY